MDHTQDSRLLEALAAVPDPRHARGKRHDWTFILGVIGSAMLSQQRSIAAIAQWAQAHADALVAAFQPQRPRVPSEATLRRALRHIDVPTLELHLARRQPRPSRAPMQARAARLQGYAVDGNYVRGAGTHGHRTLLVSLVRQRDGRVIAQQAVAPQHHAGNAITQLRTGRDLRGMVITLDAGLTDPKLAPHILAQGGHYLMVVQRNQAQRYQDLVWYCDTPPLPCDRPWRTHRAVSKGHGRLAERRLNCRDDLDDERTWPGVQQVLQRTCDRTELKTGAVTYATSYALTSVPAAVAPAADVARWWRKHWAIEHQVHDVRDVTLGEDAHQMDTGQAPQVLAALRNALLNRLREAGWTNIAAAVRHYSWSVTNALQFLGVGAS